MNPVIFTPKIKEEERGFIALISVIIISVILLGITTTLSTSSFLSRFDEINAEYKRVSLGLAESCVNAALRKIASNYNYQVTTDPAYDISRKAAVITIGSDNCLIQSPTSTPQEVNNKKIITILSQGSYHGAFSNMLVTVTAQNPTSTPIIPPFPPPNIIIDSWQETPTSTGY